MKGKKELKRAGIIILTMAILFSFAACGSKAESDGSAGASKSTVSEVNISYFVGVDDNALLKEAGYFEESLGEDVTVNWLSVDGGRDMINGILSDSFDFAAGIGAPPVTIGITTEVPFKVVWLTSEIGTLEGLVVRESAGINSVADLKGKDIATVVSSTDHYSLIAALELNGLKAEDVNIIDLSPQDTIAAWQRGDIDATYIWSPHLDILVEDGGKVLIDSSEIAEAGSPTSSYVLVNNKFADKYPDIVEKYIDGLIKAHDLYANNKDEAAKLWAKALEITPELALSQAAGQKWFTAEEQLDAGKLGSAGAPGQSAQGLKKIGDFLVDQGSLEKKVGLDVYKSYIDVTYISGAIK